MNLDKLSQNIYDFVCDYRKYSNWYFYDNEIKNIKDVKELLLKDNGIDFMQDFSNMFIFYTFHKDFSNSKENKFFDDYCSIFKMYNKYLNQLDININLNDLTNDIVKYMSDSDTYEFNDCYDSEEVACNQVYNDLLTKDGTNSIIEFLSNEIQYYTTERDITESDTEEEFNKVIKLYKDVKNYSKVFEKDDLEL